MMRKNFYTMLMATLTTMSGLISCGTTRNSMLQDNPELIIALGGSSYTQLSDADKYDAAEYLVRKGQYENARVIFEDIITHNPGVVAVKYKLAQLYLKLDSVTFAEKTPKGDTYYFTKNGAELGEAVLREIYEKDPWFLPAYSELMMLEAKRQNYDGVKAIYEKAITKH
ncbi:MAG TPA: tetratricopeptide repeat protein, partial [bacterium]|nr:tetratricopeptide repeat protein [bacterium]